MKSLKGSLLIAAPGLSDPNFARTVVFMAEHNKEGAFGLVLNRPLEVKVADLWESIASAPCPSTAVTFRGGPVQENAVIFLHGCADLAGSAEPVVPGVFVGSDVELLAKVLERSDTDRDVVRVFCGYSGWGAGQLDGEMKAGGWLTIPASAEHVFTLPPEKLWALTLQAVGGDYRYFAFMPLNPDLN
jgi:putative transcriptional regulator